MPCNSEIPDPPSLESVDTDVAWRTSGKDEQSSGTQDPLPAGPQDLPGQDQPLSFNTDRLPLIVGRSRAGTGSHGADGLTHALLSGLPNLQSSPLAQALSAQRGGVAAATSSSCAPQSTPHVLGLASYWSSDEDTWLTSQPTANHGCVGSVIFVITAGIAGLSVVPSNFALY